MWSQAFVGNGIDRAEDVVVDASDNIIVTGHFNVSVDFGGGPLTSAGFFDIFLAKYDSNGVHTWSRSFGGTERDIGYGLAVNASMEIHLTGQFDGTIDFGGGPLTSAGVHDIFVAKFTANGAHLWSKGAGDTDYDHGRGIAVDHSDNVFATGFFAIRADFGGGPISSRGQSMDIFLVKFDGGGTQLWADRYGGGGVDNGTDVAVDGAGNSYVTGHFEGFLSFGGPRLTTAGETDIFLAKYDLSGSHQWSMGFGGLGADEGKGVAVDGAGDVVLTGHFTDTVDFGGGPLTSAGSSDVFLAKFDAAGNHIWSSRYGDANSQTVARVDANAAGQVVITGTFFGTIDFGGGPLVSAGFWDVFIAVFDASGTHLWSRRFGDADWEDAGDVIFNPIGFVVTTGFFRGTIDFGGGPLVSAGGEDAYLATFTSSGAHHWSQAFGGAGLDQGTCVETNAAGDLFLTGSFRNSIDFGGGPLISAGSYDVFLAKFNAVGVHQWSQRHGGTSLDLGYSLALDSSGDVVLGGHFFGTANFGGGPLTSAGGEDIFLVKYTGAGGTHEWSERFGDANQDQLRRVALDPADNLLLTGFFMETIDFGGDTLRSLGSADGFLAKLGNATVGVGPTGVEAPRMVMWGAYPNPFHSETEIVLDIPVEMSGSVAVYTVSGRLVRTLVEGDLAPGRHVLPWDGRDDLGREVAPGVFLARMEAGGRGESLRIVRVR